MKKIEEKQIEAVRASKEKNEEKATARQKATKMEFSPFKQRCKQRNPCT